MVKQVIINEPTLSINSDKSGDEKLSIWNSILRDVKSSTKKAPQTKCLVVLGDNESGRTTLVARLQGNDDPKRGAGLEYHYIDVKDDDRDDTPKLGIWILDGDVTCSASLLKFAIKPEVLENTVLVLVASMTQPWALLSTLNKWIVLVEEHIERLKLDPERLREMRERFQYDFQNFVEADISSTMPTSSTSSITTGKSVLSDDDGRLTNSHINVSITASSSGKNYEQVTLPLSEGVLTKSLGIPIIVVVTKCDHMSTLAKDNEYEDEHFDFMQYHLRKFCLQYGAALFYTSVKEKKNIDKLYKYIMHKCYGYPFMSTASVVEHDAILIPAGWDNPKKIDILLENLHRIKPTDNYSDVFMKVSVRRPLQRDSDVIIAEDDQEFLSKLQLTLNKTASPGQTDDSENLSSSRLSGTNSSNNVQTPVTTRRLLNQPNTNAGSAGSGTGSNEGALADFFSKLITRKSGAASSPTGTGASLTQRKLSPSPTTPSKRLQQHPLAFPVTLPPGRPRTPTSSKPFPSPSNSEPPSDYYPPQIEKQKNLESPVVTSTQIIETLVTADNLPTESFDVAKHDQVLSVNQNQNHSSEVSLEFSTNKNQNNLANTETLYNAQQIDTMDNRGQELCEQQDRGIVSSTNVTEIALQNNIISTDLKESNEHESNLTTQTSQASPTKSDGLDMSLIHDESNTSPINLQFSEQPSNSNADVFQQDQVLVPDSHIDQSVVRTLDLTDADRENLSESSVPTKTILASSSDFEQDKLESSDHDLLDVATHQDSIPSPSPNEMEQETNRHEHSPVLSQEIHDTLQGDQSITEVHPENDASSSSAIMNDEEHVNESPLSLLQGDDNETESSTQSFLQFPTSTIELESNEPTIPSDLKDEPIAPEKLSDKRESNDMSNTSLLPIDQTTEEYNRPVATLIEQQNQSSSIHSSTDLDSSVEIHEMQHLDEQQLTNGSMTLMSSQEDEVQKVLLSSQSVESHHVQNPEIDEEHIPITDEIQPSSPIKIEEKLYSENEDSSQSKVIEEPENDLPTKIMETDQNGNYSPLHSDLNDNSLGDQSASVKTEQSMVQVESLPLIVHKSTEENESSLSINEQQSQAQDSSMLVDSQSQQKTQSSSSSPTHEFKLNESLPSLPNIHTPDESLNQFPDVDSETITESLPEIELTNETKQFSSTTNEDVQKLTQSSVSFTEDKDLENQCKLSLIENDPTQSQLSSAINEVEENMNMNPAIGTDDMQQDEENRPSTTKEIYAMSEMETAEYMKPSPLPDVGGESEQALSLSDVDAKPSKDSFSLGITDDETQHISQSASTIVNEETQKNLPLFSPSLSTNESQPSELLESAEGKNEFSSELNENFDNTVKDDQEKNEHHVLSPLEQNENLFESAVLENKQNSSVLNEHEQLGSTDNGIQESLASDNRLETQLDKHDKSVVNETETSDHANSLSCIDDDQKSHLNLSTPVTDNIQEEYRISEIENNIINSTSSEVLLSTSLMTEQLHENKSPYEGNEHQTTLSSNDNLNEPNTTTVSNISSLLKTVNVEETNLSITPEKQDQDVSSIITDDAPPNISLSLSAAELKHLETIESNNSKKLSSSDHHIQSDPATDLLSIESHGTSISRSQSSSALTRPNTLFFTPNEHDLDGLYLSNEFDDEVPMSENHGDHHPSSAPTTLSSEHSYSDDKHK